MSFTILRCFPQCRPPSVLLRIHTLRPVPSSQPLPGTIAPGRPSASAKTVDSPTFNHWDAEQTREVRWYCDGAAFRLPSVSRVDKGPSGAVHKRPHAAHPKVHGIFLNHSQQSPTTPNNPQQSPTIPNNPQQSRGLSNNPEAFPRIPKNPHKNPHKNSRIPNMQQCSCLKTPIFLYLPTDFIAFLNNHTRIVIGLVLT